MMEEMAKMEEAVKHPNKRNNKENASRNQKKLKDTSPILSMKKNFKIVSSTYEKIGSIEFYQG